MRPRENPKSEGGAVRAAASLRKEERLVRLQIRRLRRPDLPSDTVELARYLIGKILVHDVRAGRLSGRIVETEAYVVGDAACHAYRGPTRRNASLYLEHGHAYVYLIYGTSYMLNVAGEAEGTGAAVLLRALEPMEGISLMRQYRRTDRLTDLARGPGCLAAALRIGRRHDGVDLCGGGNLWLGTAALPTGPIGVSVRIGITKEAGRPLRFYERGSPFVSGPKRLNS